MIGRENSRHFLNQLEVNLNRLCVFPRFTPATSVLESTCDCFIGGNCLRYDSLRNNFGFGITTLRPQLLSRLTRH